MLPHPVRTVSAILYLRNAGPFLRSLASFPLPAPLCEMPPAENQVDRRLDINSPLVMAKPARMAKVRPEGGAAGSGARRLSSRDAASSANRARLLATGYDTRLLTSNWRYFSPDAAFLSLLRARR